MLGNGIRSFAIISILRTALPMVVQDNLRPRPNPHFVQRGSGGFLSDWQSTIRLNDPSIRSMSDGIQFPLTAGATGAF